MSVSSTCCRPRLYGRTWFLARQLLHGTSWNATCSYDRMPVGDASHSSELDEPRSRLLVIESGAPVLIPDSIEEFQRSVAITQFQGESSAAFAERALRRITFAAQSGQRFDAAALVVGPNHDERTCAARRLMGLAIAEYAESVPTLTELVVIASADACPELRERLLELADDLVFGAAGTPLSVRIRFVEAKQAGAARELPLVGARLRERSTVPAATNRHARGRRSVAARLPRARRDD